MGDPYSQLPSLCISTLALTFMSVFTSSQDLPSPLTICNCPPTPNFHFPRPSISPLPCLMLCKSLSILCIFCIIPFHFLLCISLPIHLPSLLFPNQLVSPVLHCIFLPACLFSCQPCMYFPLAHPPYIFLICHSSFSSPSSQIFCSIHILSFSCFSLLLLLVSSSHVHVFLSCFPIFLSVCFPLCHSLKSSLFIVICILKNYGKNT